MIWLDWCVRWPGPPQKAGYPSAPSRTLDQIEGEVKHSTEGPLLAALGELAKLSRRASWTFTVDTDGTAYQHYPLEAITWHCGVLGDHSRDTSLVGNLTLVGIEHVDRIGGVQLDTLTPAALAATKRITEDLRRLCFLIAANPPTLRLNEWEHGWLSQTACPSGLIPWELILEEGDMTDAEILNVVKSLRDGEFVSDGWITYRVDKLGDIPELVRVDDSKAGLITGPVRAVPLAVAQYLFHGREIT